MRYIRRVVVLAPVALAWGVLGKHFDVHGVWAAFWVLGLLASLILVRAISEPWTEKPGHGAGDAT